jgi:hypothetical protein
MREGETLELSITPRMNEAAGRPLIGVSFCGGCEFKPVTSVTENLKYSVQFTGAQIYALVTLPIKLVRGSIDPEQGRLVGLKGIFDIMEQSVSNDVEATQTQTTSSAPSPYNAPCRRFPSSPPVHQPGHLQSLPVPRAGRRTHPLCVAGAHLPPPRAAPVRKPRAWHRALMLLLAVMIYVNVRDFIDPMATSFP